jgi:hypothetical protein
MIHRRHDLPKLGLERLQLPTSPKVAKICTRLYETAVRDEGVEVIVSVESLTPEQEEDLSWTDVIEERIHKELEKMGEERRTLISFEDLSAPPCEEDSIGGD